MIFFSKVCSRATFDHKNEYKHFRKSGIRGLNVCLRNKSDKQGKEDSSCKCSDINTKNCFPGAAALATSAFAANLLAAAKADLKTKNRKLQKYFDSKTTNA